MASREGSGVAETAVPGQPSSLPGAPAASIQHLPQRTHNLRGAAREIKPLDRFPVPAPLGVIADNLINMGRRMAVQTDENRTEQSDEPRKAKVQSSNVVEAAE